MQQAIERATRQPRNELWTALGAWLVGAALIGASGVMRRGHPLVIPLVVLASNVALWRAYRARPSVRAAVDAVRSEWVFTFQASRALIGASFLYFGTKGALPSAWASHAGWGDVIVGLMALALIVLGASDPRRRALRAIFNAVGLLDIASVLVHAQYIALVQRDARFMQTVGGLPFALLPLWIVPLVFATHGLLIARDRR